MCDCALSYLSQEEEGFLSLPFTIVCQVNGNTHISPPPGQCGADRVLDRQGGGLSPLQLGCARDTEVALQQLSPGPCGSLSKTEGGGET